MSEKDLVAAPQIKIDADWVMEPEVPRPAGTFLQHTTKRIFMEDRVDLRVRFEGFSPTTNASVKFEVRTSATPGSSLIGAVFIGTDGLDVSAAQKTFRVAQQRTLQGGSNLNETPESDSAKAIFLQIDGTGGVGASMVTSIVLPFLDADKVLVHYRMTVKDQGQELTALSTNIVAVRWFADPAQNLTFPPTVASRIQPLIDGDAFFGRVSALLKAATKQVLIATWTFWMDLFLTGEPGPGTGQLSVDIRAAAVRGVKILILVDVHNGEWVAPMLNKHLSGNNIFVRTSTHPHKVFGIKQSGSYHEKYVIADSKTALVGGIDFQPDRYNSPRHNFKPEYAKYRDQDKARGPGFLFPEKRKGEEIKEFVTLWHDSAVEIEGPIVVDLENDFGRRWDLAAHVPPFVPIRPNPPPTSGHNVQLVKTDMIGASLGLGSATLIKRISGTLNAYTQAIAGARHYIYIENQYFNFQPLAKLIEDALSLTPTLQLIVILPFDTEEAREDDKREHEPRYGIPLSSSDIRKVRQATYRHSLFLQKQIVDRLRKVPNASNRVGFFALASQIPGKPKPEEVYPHSKVMIVDDTWAIMGSANTNGRGFKIDSEVNVVIHSRNEVTALRNALWKEHLGVELSTRQIRDFFKEWNQRAVKGVTKAEDISPGTLGNLHAVVLTNPPAGQKYNGQLEFIGTFFGIIDDEV